jgi:hypothetical protein
MPTAVPLPQDLGRFGYALEGAFKASPGSPQNVRNLLTLDPKPARALLERAQQRNSTKDGYSPHIGNQSYELGFEHLCSDQTADDLGDLIGTAMGEEVASATITFASGTQTTVTKTAGGTFDDILKVLGSDGRTYYMPVKSVSGNVATFAHRLPTGVTAAGCVNASDAGGRAFRDKHDGTVNTYHAYTDQAGYTGERVLTAQGAVPTPFKIVWNLEQLLKLSMGLTGATWSISTSASGLSDSNDGNHGYTSDAISLGIQDLSAAAALTELGPKALEFSMGYEFRKGTAGQGATYANPTLTLPASNVTRWIRGNPIEETIKITLDEGDYRTWDEAVKDKTPYSFWTEFQPGNMGATALASRICVWFPRVIPVQAMPTKVDGQQVTSLEFTIERNTTGSATRRSYLSFFVS